MVAGGVGLAPFATLAEALVERGTPTTLFYGARSGGELFYLDWFASRGVRLILATEDGTTGERGRVTLPLERELQRADGSVMIYACGPEPMLEAVSHVSAKYGRRCQVSVETRDGMRHGRLLQLRHPVKDKTAAITTCAPASAVRSSTAPIWSGTESGWWFVVGGWWFVVGGFVVGSWELGIGSGGSWALVVGS
jgi:NAD(P)H-flavin reductase